MEESSSKRLGSLHKNSVDPFVVLQLYLQIVVHRTRSGDVNRRVVSLRKSTIRRSGKITHAQRFAVSRFTADGSYCFFNVFQHLSDVVFRVAQVQNKGEFVLVGCISHIGMRNVGL